LSVIFSVIVPVIDNRNDNILVISSPSVKDQITRLGYIIWNTGAFTRKIDEIHRVADFCRYPFGHLLPLLKVGVNTSPTSDLAGNALFCEGFALGTMNGVLNCLKIKLPHRGSFCWGGWTCTPNGVSEPLKSNSLTRREFFAGDNGFEPLLIAPEAIVLPLDESPLNQRAIFYHAHRDEASLFACCTAGIVFNIHENKQKFANALNTNEIPQTRHKRLKDP
jgi:hypothetical protein